MDEMSFPELPNYNRYFLFDFQNVKDCFVASIEAENIHDAAARFLGDNLEMQFFVTRPGCVALIRDGGRKYMIGQVSWNSDNPQRQGQLWLRIPATDRMKIFEIWQEYPNARRK